MLKVPVAKEEASAVLNEIREPLMCTMFVFESLEIAQTAELRANTPLRRVAFVEEPSVIIGAPGYEAVARAHQSGATVVAMTIGFQVSSTLTEAEADIGALEDAFAKAEVDS